MTCSILAFPARPAAPAGVWLDPLPLSVKDALKDAAYAPQIVDAVRAFHAAADAYEATHGRRNPDPCLRALTAAVEPLGGNEGYTDFLVGQLSNRLSTATERAEIFAARDAATLARRTFDPLKVLYSPALLASLTDAEVSSLRQFTHMEDDVHAYVAMPGDGGAIVATYAGEMHDYDEADPIAAAMLAWIKALRS
jgi:hypothetical protein